MEDSYLMLAFTSLPFIFIGTMMTIRRLRDVGLPVWLVLCFFLPFLNLLFFLMLCLLPSNSLVAREPTQAKWLSRIILKSKWGSAALSVFVTSVLGAICGAISIYAFGEYPVSVLFPGNTIYAGINGCSHIRLSCT